ncbi:outer membrane protein [Ruegeria lacuscaerulensis]|uniref:outer membrane protein n=1 Tax=Ruegeria lacuscaerulensis TaxID=55218 RepID=UPI003013C485
MVVERNKTKLCLQFVLAVMVSLLGLSGAAIAGNTDAALSDPPVLDPQRVDRDVSAFYLGLTAGYASGGTDQFGLATPGGTFPIGELDLNGSFGGVRAGWRGVLPAKGGRDYVYGLEIGYEFGSIDDETTALISGTTVTGGSEVSDVLSIRFRNGLTNKSGSILYFVSAGYVRGDIETTNSITTGATTQSFQESDSRDGFSLSIGAEHYLNDDWSITGEYEYVQFQGEDIEFGNGFSTRSTPEYRSLRFGLTYTF